jgi:hypothetical protein
MGQLYLELRTSYTGNSDNTGTLHVSQLPPNPAIFPPGPALIFVVVDGVPSIGQQIMVGSGRIEKQKAQSVQDLPASQVASVQSSASGSGGGSGGTTKDNGELRSVGSVQGLAIGVAVSLGFLVGCWFWALLDLVIFVKVVFFLLSWTWFYSDFNWQLSSTT